MVAIFAAGTVHGQFALKNCAPLKSVGAGEPFCSAVDVWARQIKAQRHDRLRRLPLVVALTVFSEIKFVCGLLGVQSSCSILHPE